MLRTDAIRGLAVGDGKLPDGEYVAIATDALSDNEARQAKEWLKDTLCPEDKTSIWVLAKPEDGKSIFSLSQLINRWLDELNKDEAERILIDIIWPLKTPAEMIEELNKFREAAWELLSKA